MTPGDVARLLGPLSRRIWLQISRGVLRRTDDGGDLQQVQVSMLAAEDRDQVERFQPYGLSSVPVAGAEAIVVAVAGNRDHPVAIAVDDRRFRPTGLQAGEVCLYSRAPGQRITLLADGTILIQGAAVRIEAPVEIVGDVQVTGDLAATGTITASNVVAQGISLRTHTHGAGGAPQ